SAGVRMHAAVYNCHFNDLLCNESRARAALTAGSEYVCRGLSTLPGHAVCTLRPQRPQIAEAVPWAVAEFRRHDPVRERPRNGATLVRRGHYAFRSRKQLWPAIRIRRGELRQDATDGSRTLSRRDRDFDEGRLQHVAGSLRRMGLAEVSARELGSEPEALGCRLRRHLLLASSRPGNAARRDNGGTRHRGSQRPCALRRDFFIWPTQDA